LKAETFLRGDLAKGPNLLRIFLTKIQRNLQKSKGISIISLKGGALGWAPVNWAQAA